MPATPSPPSDAKPITSRDGRLVVPDHPVVPYIEGDGTGPDIWRATKPVLDGAVARAYAGRRRIGWLRILAGESAHAAVGDALPPETVEAIRTYLVAIKGPLTTPVGGGHRSLNVTLRQTLDLYTCIRPVRWFPGVPAPVVSPQKLDVVIFRENTEDVYAGVEWPSGSKEATSLISHLNATLGTHLRDDSAIGIKPMSPMASKRLVRAAIRYALTNKRRSVTLVHKGNIMKFTEGAFRDWGYQVATEEFGDVVVTEKEVEDRYCGVAPAGKLLLNDRIADAMFQQLLLRPDEYDVIATPNLNGDYISDACAAQVGGLGIAPGANIGDSVGIFEATHGTAPKYAGQDKVNPGSLILSGAMLLRHIGWGEAASLVETAFGKTIAQKVVTYDLARQISGVEPTSCSGFGRAVIANMD